MAPQCKFCLVNETKMSLVFNPVLFTSSLQYCLGCVEPQYFQILKLTSFHIDSIDKLGEECHFFSMSVCLSYLFHCCDKVP